MSGMKPMVELRHVVERRIRDGLPFGQRVTNVSVCPSRPGNTLTLCDLDRFLEFARESGAGDGALVSVTGSDREPIRIVFAFGAEGDPEVDG